AIYRLRLYGRNILRPSSNTFTPHCHQSPLARHWRGAGGEVRYTHLPFFSVSLWFNLFCSCPSLATHHSALLLLKTKTPRTGFPVQGVTTENWLLEAVTPRPACAWLSRSSGAVRC